MSNIISLFPEKRAESYRPFNDISCLKQKKFRRHEIRAIGEIQSGLVNIGFSNDPRLSFAAAPDSEGVTNTIVLRVDVHQPEYQRIFGETFDIAISKFENKEGQEVFKMETPLCKSSGSFADVIRFIQRFINTNLKPTDGRVHTLVASS